MNIELKTIEKCFYQRVHNHACNEDCCDCTPENLKKDCEKYKPIKVLVYEIK